MQKCYSFLATVFCIEIGFISIAAAAENNLKLCIETSPKTPFTHVDINKVQIRNHYQLKNLADQTVITAQVVGKSCTYPKLGDPICGSTFSCPSISIKVVSSGGAIGNNTINSGHTLELEYSQPNICTVTYHDRAHWRCD